MKKIIQDFSSFRPSERPAIGEKVTIISGPWKGHEGRVTGTNPKNKDMKERQIIVTIEIDPGYGMTSQCLEIKTSRDMLVDVNGDSMPKYSTQRELKMMEWRREQYARLKNALDELGYEPYDYFHQEHGMSHSDVEKLETGEDGLDSYLDDDECEKMGAGREWILYGDERSKEHPCGRRMKEYLNEHPERWEIVRKWMREDGCTVYNWSPDEYEEEDDYMSGFDEDDWE